MVFENKYSYKSGFNYKVSPQIVGEALAALGEKTEITAQTFLDASRDEDSPTHDLFEWDDAVAAEKYRLNIAGCVIRAIEVTRVPVDEPATKEVTVEATEQNDQTYSRAYVNVNKSQGFQPANFVPVVRAMSNSEMRAQVLQNALDELEAYKR